MPRRSADVELVWPGKSKVVTDRVIPLDHVAVVGQSGVTKVESEKIVGDCEYSSPRDFGEVWKNMLIKGDNKYVLSTLGRGPLRNQIESAGGIRLIYIDPPFFVGAKYSACIRVGDEQSPNGEKVVKDIAYSDTWELGISQYLSTMYERLILMRDLMAEDGSIWVHCDWRVNFLLRALLNEVFGPEAFRNEIVWYYRNKIPDTRKRQYTNSTDTIYYYAKSHSSPFHWQFDKRKKPIKVSRMKKINGKKIYLKDENGKGLYDVREYRTADNVWQFPLLHAQPEIVGFPTQKPESLIQRIICTASDPGDIVADFFCGSGTTLVVAQRLGRKWIGCDSSGVAVQTARKRLVQVQRDLMRQGQTSRDFEILRLRPLLAINGRDEIGHASRESNDMDSSERGLRITREILSTYNAEPNEQPPLFCGRKGEVGVVVSPQDTLVDKNVLRKVIDEACKSSFRKVHVLAWEYDCGLRSVVFGEAAEAGITMTLKKISGKEVQWDREQMMGWRFHDVPYVRFEPRVNDLKVTIALMEVGMLGHHHEPITEAVPKDLKTPLVELRGGKITRLKTTKEGILIREVLSEKWQDWIDYWAVDFTYGEGKDVSTISGFSSAKQTERPKIIFHEHWQSFKTRKKRNPEFVSSPYTYSRRGVHTVAVKIVDILGNEAMDIARIKV